MYAYSVPMMVMPSEPKVEDKMTTEEIIAQEA